MGRGRTSREALPIIIPRLGDPVSVSVDERDEHLMLLEAARHALDVEWIETLAAAEAAGDHDVMGFPSMVAYLKHRMRMAGGRAHRYVRNARAALESAATFSAWKHRQLSTDEVELMFRASERMPDKYPEAENVLLELVGDGVDETRKVLEYWRNDVDLPGVTLELEEQQERRHLDITRKGNGMVAGEFALPRLEGETLLTALDALMPPPSMATPGARVNAEQMRSATSLGATSRAQSPRLSAASGPTSTCTWTSRHWKAAVAGFMRPMMVSSSIRSR
jgi:hypothetical protein